MKNSFLYFIRGIAAFFVVFIHVRFPGETGETVKALARFAVPFFFMISGYFSFGRSNEKIRNNAQKTIKLALYTMCLYSCWYIIKTFPDGKEITQTITSWFSFSSIMKLLLFNLPLSETGFFCWFLLAQAYVYFIYMFICKYEKHDLGCIIGLILLLIYIVVERAQYIVFWGYHGYYFINFLFTGFPFFMLGNYLARKKERIMSWNMQHSIFVCLLVVGTLLTIIEKMFIGNKELYISNILVCLVSFVYAIKEPRKFEGNLIGEIGKKYGLYIYLFHIIIRDLVNFFVKSISLGDTWLKWFIPIIVCIITTIVSMIWYRFSQRFEKTT